MRYKYTAEDIKFLEENYPVGNWDKIHKRFQNISDRAIQHKCSRLGIKFNNDFKIKFDSKIHTRKKWTKDEIKYLKNNYSSIPVENIREHLNDRSIDSIILKANSLGLQSYSKICSSWTCEQIKYIQDNWELTPDIIMAKHLGKSFRSVKWKREELKLFRTDFDSKSYPTLSKYLRGQNQEWKKKSMENCDYKCVLTRSKKYEIHHLYGVSNMINDILNRYPQYKNKDFSEYNLNDLNFLKNLFLEEQSKYPLGECVDKSIHTLFHSLYGQYYNTPEQWYKFKKDYKKGVYENIA